MSGGPFNFSHAEDLCGVYALFRANYHCLEPVSGGGTKFLDIEKGWDMKVLRRRSTPRNTAEKVKIYQKMRCLHD